jgi:hypothetical protein
MKSLPFMTLLAASLSIATAHGQLPDSNPVYLSYLGDESERPIIDGVIDPGEWTAAGEPHFISAEGTKIPADPFGGDADLSFQFRTMWVAPWDVYFLIEINDDIAMDAAHNPADRTWERDQVELFVDGDELTGGNIQWWTGEPIDPYGKFGAARTNEFEGNAGVMIEDWEEVGMNGIVASAVAGETGVNGNYVVEYLVSMKPAWENGMFAGTNAELGTLIPNETAIKFQLGVSDNDNFVSDDGSLNQSGYAGYLFHGIDGIEGQLEWWQSDGYPNLLFTDFYVPSSDLDCDFDANNSCDISDLNALLAAVGSTDSQFDLDSSGNVDLADRDAWLASAGNEVIGVAFVPGDADLDGDVDAGDLNALGGNWRSAADLQWQHGNFNGDSIVDAQDLNAIGGNWQHGVLVATPAQLTVPEPASFALMVVGLLALRSKRQSFVQLLQTR